MFIGTHNHVGDTATKDQTQLSQVVCDNFTLVPLKYSRNKNAAKTMAICNTEV